jgi:hypothetical protein
MGWVVDLSVSASDSHRRLAEMTGVTIVNGGGRRSVSFARVFRVIFRRALVQTSDTRLVPAGGLHAAG